MKSGDKIKIKTKKQTLNSFYNPFVLNNQLMVNDKMEVNGTKSRKFANLTKNYFLGYQHSNNVIQIFCHIINFLKHVLTSFYLIIDLY